MDDDQQKAAQESVVTALRTAGETLVPGWDLQQACGATMGVSDFAIADAYGWSRPMLERIPAGSSALRGTNQADLP